MCRHLDWAISFVCRYCLFESILTSEPLEDDLKGLLPPTNMDHSTR